ncbi:hypothetical protein RHSIM_Rhsim03G0013300 [Rhododendron simsii]|uniref:Uncharacterized protein n=1 Tax=Rhododendron simsii TaxID=118357 RepID=A0A834HIA1_RHOSS|nr:hypothetical protein RHSIM_Rhsim03G0013300 [Rhododendron simsii]
MGAWVAWDNLTEAKEDGDVGFRDYRAFNEAMLARQGFKLSSTKPANSCIDRVYDIIDSRKRQWDKQKLAGKVSAVELEAILDISLPVVDRVDQLVWHFSSNGIYSVNQSMTERKENPKPSFKPSKAVWRIKAPIKVKFFWWQVH